MVFYLLVKKQKYYIKQLIIGISSLKEAKVDDPIIDIKWPLLKSSPILSKKDSIANSLNNIDKDDLFK